MIISEANYYYILSRIATGRGSISLSEVARPSNGSSSIAKLALVAGILGLILGGAGFAYSVYIGQTGVSATGLPTVNQTPGNITMRVDWLNSFNSGQDRFNPTFFTVAQGDRVVVIFETNDTSDSHTFELSLGLAGFSGVIFRLNNSWPGLTSGPYVGPLTSLGNAKFNFTQYATGCTDGQGSPVTCNTRNSPIPTGYGYQCDPSSPPGTCIEQTGIPCGSTGPCACPGLPGQAGNNGTSTVTTDTCNLSSTGFFVATVPGVYEFQCFYHAKNGMFGYITVLPNQAYKP